MLRIPRPIGSRVIVGDHTVISVVSADSDGAVLGFESRQEITRADSPEYLALAAKVIGRIRHTYAPKEGSLERLPVFVAHRADGNSLDVRASLRRETVDLPGYRLAEMTDETRLTPAGHEFLVIRSADPRELAGARKLISSGVLPWVYYETVERPDSTLYSLFVRSVPHNGENQTPDVRYVDFIEEEMPK